MNRVECPQQDGSSTLRRCPALDVSSYHCIERHCSDPDPCNAWAAHSLRNCLNHLECCPIAGWNGDVRIQERCVWLEPPSGILALGWYDVIDISSPDHPEHSWMAAEIVFLNQPLKDHQLVSCSGGITKKERSTARDQHSRLPSTISSRRQPYVFNISCV